MKLSKKAKIAVTAGAAAAVVIAVAVILILHFSGRVPSGFVTLSEKGSLECRVEATGILEPLMKYIQKGKSEASVKELLVKSGDRVEKGDTVAYLDSEYTDMLFSLMRQKDEAEMLVAGGNAEAQTTCDSLSQQIDSILENPEAAASIFVSAEVSGRICRISIESGKSISAGDSLFEIDDDRVYTVTVQTEPWVPLLPYGSTVKLYNSEGKELGFTGKTVKRFDTASSNGYTFSIEGDCGDYYEDLSFVTAKLDFGKADGYILPRDTVLSDGGTDYVYIYEKGNAKRVDVAVSLSDGKNVCITDGLKNDMKVLTSPSELEDGKKVKLING